MKRISAIVLAVLLIAAPFFSFADSEPEAKNLSAACEYTSSANPNALFRVRDKDSLTHLNFGENGYLSVSWDESLPVSRFCVYFASLPKAYTVSRYSFLDELIDSRTIEGGRMTPVFELEAGTGRIELRSDYNMDIVQARVYGEGTLPEPYQPFCDVPDKLDYLIVSTHPDDDVLFMGAIVPLFGVDKGYEGAIAYMTTGLRDRIAEALNGAWAMGLKNYPFFASFPDIWEGAPESEKQTFVYQDVVTYLVRLYRKHRPSVVFSHDLEGEYGHWQHKLVARAVLEACSLAADAGFDSASAESLGVWQVAKCYLHLYSENAIKLDVHAPLDAFDGLSAFEVAKRAMRKHPSQAAIGYGVEDSGVYSLSDFGLAFNYYNGPAEPVFEGVEPSPTPEPSVTPEPTPTLAPNQTSDAKQIPKEEKELMIPTTVTPSFNWLLAAAALFILVCAALFIFVYTRLRRRLSTGVSVVLCLLPLIIALAFIIAFIAAPTAAAGDDEHFSDGAEIVVEDAEHGRWEYRNDSLGVFIERRNGTVISEDNGREYPLVYYVAHIYMRSYDSFRMGFADEGASGVIMYKPWEVSRRNKAVVAITGDNFRYEQDMKGAIIRNGRVYNKKAGESVLAFKDDMTMEIFMKGEYQADELLEMGIRNTASFGPWLIKDGQLNERVHVFRVNRVNPRVGVGMVERGHFVLIVVDGRQADYSYGITLTQFQRMFADEGCTDAYNLDGGCSTGITFMGESLNYHDGRSGAADFQRPWPDALMWGYSELVPAVTDPVYNDGNQKWGN